MDREQFQTNRVDADNSHSVAGIPTVSTAPVATRVSAPPDDVWPLVEEYYDEFKASLDSETELEPFDKWCECPVAKALIKFYVAGASSSSAALLAANEVIRRQLKKVCDQAEAAEAKCAELREELEEANLAQRQFDKVLTIGHLILDGAVIPSAVGQECNDPDCESQLIHRLKALRDSRDRFQAELNKPCCGERHRMNHELKVAALGDPPNGEQR